MKEVLEVTVQSHAWEETEAQRSERSGGRIGVMGECLAQEACGHKNPGKGQHPQEEGLPFVVVKNGARSPICGPADLGLSRRGAFL